MDHLFRDYVELYSRINKNEWITIFEENDTKNYDNDICVSIHQTTARRLQIFL